MRLTLYRYQTYTPNDYDDCNSSPEVPKGYPSRRVTLRGRYWQVYSSDPEVVMRAVPRSTRLPALSTQ